MFGSAELAAPSCGPGEKANCERRLAQTILLVSCHVQRLTRGQAKRIRPNDSFQVGGSFVFAELFSSSTTIDRPVPVWCPSASPCRCPKGGNEYPAAAANARFRPELAGSVGTPSLSMIRMPRTLGRCPLGNHVVDLGIARVDRRYDAKPLGISGIDFKPLARLLSRQSLAKIHTARQFTTARTPSGGRSTAQQAKILPAGSNCRARQHNRVDFARRSDARI